MIFVVVGVRDVVVVVVVVGVVCVAVVIIVFVLKMVNCKDDSSFTIAIVNCYFC